MLQNWSSDQTDGPTTARLPRCIEMQNRIAHLLNFKKSLPRISHPLKRLRKSFKTNFWYPFAMDILVSIELILQALQTEISRFIIGSVKSKIPKFPEFNLPILDESFNWEGYWANNHTNCIQPEEITKKEKIGLPRHSWFWTKLAWGY